MNATARHRRQSGTTLVEILVTVLILSFGLLAMGAMMSYAIQLPKESGNRSVAISSGSGMIERMRANASTWDVPSRSLTFSIANYATQTFSATRQSTTAPSPAGTACFPNCTQANIATQDIAEVQGQLNQQLAPAGMTIEITDAANNQGNLWIIWQSPAAFGGYSSSTSDNCPAAIVALGLTPAPRCIYLPFRL